MPKLKLVDIFELSDFRIIKSIAADNRFLLPVQALGLQLADPTAENLDFDYVYERSGLKYASMLFLRLLGVKVVDDEMYYATIYNRRRTGYKYVTWNFKVDEATPKILDILYSKFGQKWNKMAETVNAKYEILKPYSMTLESEYTDNQERTDESNNSSKTNSSSKANNDTTNKKWGFDTTDNPVPTDVSTDVGTSSNSSGSSSNSSSNGTNTRTGQNKVTRAGNIGNKSQAQLLEEERENARFLLLDTMYNDIDSILAAQHY